LQTGLTEQPPKSIVRYFFRECEIAKKAHQHCDDPGIVLKKNGPKLRFVPMLR
jgi:hypothetical protein